MTTRLMTAGVAGAVLAAVSAGCGGGQGSARRPLSSDPKLQNRLEQSGKTARENYAGQAADGSFRSPVQAQKQSDALTRPGPPAARKGNARQNPPDPSGSGNADNVQTAPSNR